MPERTWYRSLYWRIALGYVGLLAVLLAVQTGLVLQLSNRMWGRAVRTPAQLADVVAQDLSNQLRDQPEFDVETYLHQHYSTGYQPFAVAREETYTLERIIGGHADAAAYQSGA
jgi:hypothetical protein